MNERVVDREAELDASFVELEKQFVRRKAYPQFDWVRFDHPTRVNPLRKPLSECRIALVTTAGVHAAADPPFNLRSPIGDPSYRQIPGDASLDELRLSHVGYDIKRVSEDKNAVFPLDRLRELVTEGIIGSAAPRHFSFMGYVAETEPLIRQTAPEVAENLKADGVDLVILSPA